MPVEPINAGKKFAGFEYPDANFIYCPNQLFDVCLPHCSRGAVRFVAYLLYRTLRWRDEEGNPIEENITVPHVDFIRKAGISKGMVRSVTDEVISLGFARRTQEGKPKEKGSAGQSASYALRWDERGEYVRNLDAFQGFLAGGGNCSPIPIAFFTDVVPRKRLAISKVVGTTLRYTVGFESKYGGGRRQQAALSLSFIQKYANIKDRKIAIRALVDARDDNFIRRVVEGGINSAATYAPYWLEEATNTTICSKKPPVSERFKKPTTNGSISPPVDRSKKPTTRNKAQKETNKQQAAACSIQLLQQAGFDARDAELLAAAFAIDRIERQIKWIELRQPKRNRLGLLRRAIEGDWDEPTKAPDAARGNKQRQREHKQQVIREEKGIAEVNAKRDRQKRGEALLIRWRTYTMEQRQNMRQTAIDNTTSDLHRRRLRAIRDLDNPPLSFLLQIEPDLPTLMGGSS